LPGYSAAQFARLVGTTEHVIRSAIKSRFIASVTFNKQERIPPSQLAVWGKVWGNPGADSHEVTGHCSPAVTHDRELKRA